MTVTVELILRSDKGDEILNYQIKAGSHELAMAVVHHVRLLLNGDQARREQRLSQVYKALIELCDPVSGECVGYVQDEIAARIGLSTRHLRRLIGELELLGLVIVRSSANSHNPINTYSLPHLSAAFELMTISPDITTRGSGNGSSLSVGPTFGAGNGAATPGHDEPGLTKGSVSKKRRLKNIHLLFLHEGERRKRLRQAHCTPSFLQAWDDWYAAGQFGALKNPEGWANVQIKQGFLPPTVTPQLPFETEPGGDDSVLSSEIQSKELEPERLLWSSILEDLRLRCTKATYDTILAYTRLASRDNNKFKVEVRGVVAYSWLEERLKPFVTRAIATATGMAEQEIELEFVQI